MQQVPGKNCKETFGPHLAGQFLRENRRFHRGMKIAITINKAGADPLRARW
jgi:hypothetical protein